MQKLAAEGQLKSFYHSGFWQCMDTQREMNKLEGLWQSGRAPWKIWRGRTWGFGGDGSGVLLMKHASLGLHAAVLRRL